MPPFLATPTGDQNSAINVEQPKTGSAATGGAERFLVLHLVPYRRDKVPTLEFRIFVRGALVGFGGIALRRSFEVSEKCLKSALRVALRAPFQGSGAQAEQQVWN